jgi:hypothetical protein
MEVKTSSTQGISERIRDLYRIQKANIKRRNYKQKLDITWKMITKGPLKYYEGVEHVFATAG